MDTSKNNLIVLGGAGVLLLILIGFGVMGSKSEPGSVSNQTANYDLDSVPEITDEDFTRGASNAAVKLIEYSDIECPFCQDYHDELLSLVETDKLANFSWTYRHFPLTQIHPDAFSYAVAAECAGQAGNFWGYLDSLVSRVRNDERLNAGSLTALAGSLGLDSARVGQCINDATTAELVSAESNQAQAAGSTGTPFSVFEFDRQVSAAEIESIQNLFGADTAIVVSDNNMRMAIGGSIGATQIKEIVNLIVDPERNTVEQNVSEGTEE